MQISSFKYQIALRQTSTSTSLGKSFENLPSTAPSGSEARTRLESGEPTSLEAALASSRMVNPIDWLAKSDLVLIQQTTGAVIQDGKVYDESGNAFESQATSDLINILYELRNYGVPDGSRVVALKGAITAADLEKYIHHYESSWSGNVQKLDTDVIDEAISQLMVEASGR